MCHPPHWTVSQIGQLGFADDDGEAAREDLVVAAAPGGRRGERHRSRRSRSFRKSLLEGEGEGGYLKFDQRRGRMIDINIDTIKAACLKIHLFENISVCTMIITLRRIQI